MRYLYRHRFLIMSGLLVFLAAPALLAQATDFGSGGGASEATLMVSKMYRNYKIVAQAVAGICAVIGGVKVYGRMMEGSSEGRRSILVWFSAALFCLFIFPILDKLFGA